MVSLLHFNDSPPILSPSTSSQLWTLTTKAILKLDIDQPNENDLIQSFLARCPTLMKKKKEEEEEKK